METFFLEVDCRHCEKRRFLVALFEMLLPKELNEHQKKTALIPMIVLYTDITRLNKCVPLLYSDIKALNSRGVTFLCIVPHNHKVDLLIYVCSGLNLDLKFQRI